MKDEGFNIESTDFWLKIVGFLQHNWCVIENTESGCTVYFFFDTAGIFDQLDFCSVDDAVEALRRNGFIRYEEDQKSQECIAKPERLFHRQQHPKGPIYSSGRYWR